MIGPERCQILVGLVPILLLALGGMHLHDCPKEPMIPIYVIVGSSFFLFIQLILVCGCGQLCLLPICLVLVFLFSWFIAGSVYIYRAFKPDFESRRSPDYCEKILYDTAFWCNNLGWVCIVVFGIAALCRCLCRIFLEKSERQDDIEEGSGSEGGDEIEKGDDKVDGSEIEGAVEIEKGDDKGDGSGIEGKDEIEKGDDKVDGSRIEGRDGIEKADDKENGSVTKGAEEITRGGDTKEENGIKGDEEREKLPTEN